MKIRNHKQATQQSKRTAARKRLMSILLTLVLLFAMMPARQVRADETISSSMDYTLGGTQSGSFTENGAKRDYYKFTLPSSGRVDIKAMCYYYYGCFYIYDERAKEIWKTTEYWNSTSEVISLEESVFLTAGTYCFCVDGDGRTGNYNFSLDFTSANESFAETNSGSNNSMETASQVQVNGATYIGMVGQNDEKDFYTFTLAESGCVNFKATFEKIYHIYWCVYDEAGKVLTEARPYWNETTQNITVDEDIHLTVGTYYLALERYNYYGIYDFDLSYKPSGENNAESNGGKDNDINHANQMAFNTSYKGQLALNDDRDFYQFSLGSSQEVKINLTAYMQHIKIKLYDAQGKEIWSPYEFSWNESAKKIVVQEQKALDAGTYYLAVLVYSGRYGNYTISVGTAGSKSNDIKDDPNGDGTGGSAGGGGSSGEEPVYKESKTIKYRQTIAVQYSGATLSFQKLKKEKRTFEIGAVAPGKITYSVAKGVRYISVSKKGKVTVRKGTKKGSYKVVVTAAATDTYKKAKRVIRIDVQ